MSQLYQGDLELGRLIVQRMEREQLGPDVIVEDLYYGAVAVAQRLQELRPTALVLVGAERRGRPPGTVERRTIGDLRLSHAEVAQAVAEAVTGYVSIDLVVEVCHGLGALPADTVAIEVEPASIDVAPTLSPTVAARLDDVLALVRAELRSREDGDGDMEEHRKTEQDDELREEHSIAHKEGEHERPYRPPRQPSQAPPEEEDRGVDRGGTPDVETEGTRPRQAPGE